MSSGLTSYFTLLSGLPLSLQGQTVLFVQSFHEEHRSLISQALDKESWKKCEQGGKSSVVAKLTAIPALKNAFNNSGNSGNSNNGNNGEENGVEEVDDGINVNGEKFAVTSSVLAFLR